MTDTVIDSYSETKQCIRFNLASDTNTAVGQAVTNVTSQTLDKLTFYIKKNGTPTGNATASLFECTGTVGSTGKGTGTVIATSDAYNVANLTTSFQLITFTFTGANIYTLAANHDYVLAISYSGGSGTNWVGVGIDDGTCTGAASHAGNFCAYTGIWTAFTSDDCCFYEYHTVAASTPTNALLLVGD